MELKHLRVVYELRELEGNLISKWHMKVRTDTRDALPGQDLLS